MSVLASLVGYNLQTFLVFLAVFLVVFNYVKKKEWSGLPPGPVALPLVGSLPFLGVDMREPIRKMGKKYGDIFTIYLGNQRVVILNSYDIIKEAFLKLGNHFSDRPQIYFVTELAGGLGVISSSGHLWREQRRFTHNTLRDFGVGRTLLQDKILEEVKCFIDYLETEVGKPFEPKYITSTSVSNIICSLVFGRRFEYEDPDFKMYMHIMASSIQIVGSNGILSAFPWLRYLPGDPFKGKLLLEQRDYMDGIFQRFIDEHREVLNVEEPPKDFIAAYLAAIENEKDVEGSTFWDNQLVRIIGDLFTAGTETTATTLLWGMIYMMRNPDVQTEVQREIDDVIGRDRLPEVADRENMPYTEACILELQRLGDITPFSVPHCTSDDVVLRGFKIPKNTMILPSLYSVHRDEEIYPEPFKFDPRRFLNGGKLEKKDQLIPFSVGRRMCLGEGLARMELFLFFTALLQKFTISVPEGYPLPGLQGTVGITNSPDTFHTCVNLR